MAKTGYGNFDYTCQGYWKGALHNFSIVGNHSGAVFTGSDPQTFMEGASSPFALCFGPFMAPGQVFTVASRYYNGTQSAPTWEAQYNESNPPPTPLVPTGSAFTDAADLTEPLEVCTLLEAQVGYSKTNKPIYCRKFLRGAPQGAFTPGSTGVKWAFSATAQASAAKMGNGDWYGGRVYISPTGKQAFTSVWTANEYPTNHQVPRGRKRKVTSAGSGVSAESLLEKAIALAGGVVLAGA